MNLHPTVRLRLTLLYGGLFLGASVLLIAVIYVLLSRTLAPGPLDQGSVDQQDLSAQPFTDQKSVDAQVAAARNAERADALKDVVRQSSIGLLAMAGLAILLGWVVAGRVLRPIRKITAHARRASETTLDDRIALRGPPDELKELADTFDEMLGRLTAAFTSQRQFSAQASHELRTPLAIMRAEAEVALAADDATPRERKLGEAIVLAAERSERLIDGLLALARSESAVREIAPLDLGDLVGDAVNDYAPAADAAGVRLDLVLADAVVTGNRALLGQLVGNLIDNAIKHNQREGWVRATVETESDGAVIRVANGGAILAPAAVAALFEPFQQGQIRQRARPPGFGLGLTIVRAVATAHGGDVRADAPAGGGLVVTVRLPTAVPADR